MYLRILKLSLSLLYNTTQYFLWCWDQMVDWMVSLSEVVMGGGRYMCRCWWGWAGVGHVRRMPVDYCWFESHVVIEILRIILSSLALLSRATEYLEDLEGARKFIHKNCWFTTLLPCTLIPLFSAVKSFKLSLQWILACPLECIIY